MLKDEKYLKYDEMTVLNLSTEEVEQYYSKGYVFGRISKGYMSRTKSVRINLSKFNLTSENRRILRKTENIFLSDFKLPLSIDSYDWNIHKMGNTFYSTKFGEKTFTANKIKELITTEHNFNVLLKYLDNLGNKTLGYCISFETEKIFHYCYPFYDLALNSINNLGMGMMIKAILRAVQLDKKFVYLGSIQRESDKYKLQFQGLEYWNDNTSKWIEIKI